MTGAAMGKAKTGRTVATVVLVKIRYLETKTWVRVGCATVLERSLTNPPRGSSLWRS